MIRSGFVWSWPADGGGASSGRALQPKHVFPGEQDFIDFGFTVWMDTVLADRAELDFFVALMSPRPVRLVVLAPGSEVCRDRSAGRAQETQFEFDGYERLESDMQRELGDIGCWLDTSAMTADQTADWLVGEMAGRTTALLPGWNSWLRRLHDV